MRSLLLAAAAAAFAAPTLRIPVDDAPLSGTRYLRALSLDVRGTLPTLEEYDRLEAGETPEDLLAEWLDGDAFADEAVRYHRSLLWPNVSDIRLLSNRQRLLYEDGVYYRYLVAPNYRGGPVSCGDFEAAFDADGHAIPTVDENGWLQEGWVEVHPYWAPETTIKVCAFEAQTAEVSPLGTACDTYDSRYDPACGCGPELRWCDTFALGHVQDDGVQAPVHRSIARDLELRVRRVVDEDLPYPELLTGRTAFVNGPLVHFYKYNTETPAHVRFNELPIDPEILPDLAFTDEDTWVQLELGPEQSGLLTSPAFLMKFQTRRGRTNRFYDAFLCQPFQPPAGGIQGLDDEDPPLDLTEREGCKYCHALLEPAGAHWGRWAEYGAGYLDPAAFPVASDSCAWCAATGESCSPECSRYYVVDPISSEEDPYVGMLQSYEFLEERHEANLENGPRQLVYDTLVDGRLPTCTARNVATWLLGREPTPDEEPWVTELAEDFTASDYRFDALVGSVLRSDNYRRVK